MAESLSTWPSKRGPIAKLVPSDVYKRDAVPLVVERWYDFHDFGCHPGNPGSKHCKTPCKEGARPHMGNVELMVL